MAEGIFDCLLPYGPARPRIVTSMALLPRCLYGMLTMKASCTFSSNCLSPDCESCPYNVLTGVSAAPQVKYIEAVDAMVRHLVCRLASAEAAAACDTQYVVCISSDHSTPVLRGDHSHEPVPFAIAHIRHGSSTIRKQEHQCLWDTTKPRTRLAT